MDSPELAKRGRHMAEMNRLSQSVDSLDETHQLSKQFLTVVLGEEYFGIDLLRIQESRGWKPVTPFPNSPEHICGFSNCQGEVIPVIDLRLLLGMPFRDYSKKTVVVAVRIEQQKHSKVIGLVVDAVEQVVDVSNSDIKPMPDLGNIVNTGYLAGITDIGKDMLVLLDTDKLLSQEQLG